MNVAVVCYYFEIIFGKGFIIMTTEQNIICISLPDLVYKIANGFIQPDDLKNCFFAFLCTREYLFSNNVYDCKCPKAIACIRKLVTQAENSNRVDWLALDEGNMCYEKIYSLLKRHNIKVDSYPSQAYYYDEAVKAWLSDMLII